MLDTNKRVGEIRRMNCGMDAIIIAYRKYNDIDIRFSDGTVAEHCNYYNFNKGGISNPNLGRHFTQRFVERIGERNKMHNGMEATIIAYRKASDLDIKFADGVVVEHKSYDAFKRGAISKPKPTYVGMTKMMNCGLKAEITAYRKSNDIDVRFEDGEVVNHKKYASFVNGGITNPRLGKFASVERKFQTRLGEELVMNNGMLAKLIAYKNNNDISVQFEDGTVRDHVRYGAFKRGYIQNPNFVVSGQSIFEGVLIYYLRSHGFDHFSAKEMQEIGYGKYEIDLFNPITQVGIEIDGIHHKYEKDLQKNKRFFKDHSSELIRIRDIALPNLNSSYSTDYYINMSKGAFTNEYEEIIKTVLSTIGIHIDINLQKDCDANCMSVP